MEGLDIRHDSNLYLQEYISTLENLPSEIQYHWAEIQKRNEQLEELERHIHSRDNNLSKIHRQVMNSTETKADALKNEPIIIRKIKRDYDRIQVLADEKVQIAEQALKLLNMNLGISFVHLKLDRHLRRLDNDLDKVHDGNETRNESRSPQSMMPTRQASPINTLKLPLAEMIGEGSQRKRKSKLVSFICLTTILNAPPQADVQIRIFLPVDPRPQYEQDHERPPLQEVPGGSMHLPDMPMIVILREKAMNRCTVYASKSHMVPWLPAMAKTVHMNGSIMTALVSQLHLRVHGIVNIA
ncbi:hypothetical protein INT44_006641 [Umbelopsis vinacea]|uniref:Inhibitor of growth protein N-terminal histone-binding domain-containing protein n=1 Tax=Umbelopsis vinacea TaxID=44442 RepID=A0A8H7PEL4_9FUNG|nr:hypothetical protein INT44_006641 [Umbelopsis vinacea]